MLPVQLIHRDVHFGNFLFDEGKFSGYIDFDLSQRNKCTESQRIVQKSICTDEPYGFFRE